MHDRPRYNDVGEFRPTLDPPRRRVLRFGVLECLVVLFVPMVAACVIWIVAAGLRNAFADTGFQYLGLGVILVGLSIATRATARMLERGTLAGRR